MNRAKGIRRGKGRGTQGQSLLLFALTLPILMMVAALVLDVGWSYYTNKKAQAAADATALAAVNSVLQQVGPGGSVDCSVAGCQDAGICPTSGNLHNACLYGAANGFSNGGSGGQQTLQVAANTTSTAPGEPNVQVAYWVQATAQQTLSQWFGGMINSSPLKPGASATAALRKADVNASLYLLNRSSDCFVSALNIGLICGEDFLALGWNNITAANGIYMASSNPTGLGLPAIAAGTVAVGNVNVSAP